MFLPIPLGATRAQVTGGVGVARRTGAAAARKVQSEIRIGKEARAGRFGHLGQELPHAATKAWRVVPSP